MDGLRFNDSKDTDISLRYKTNAQAGNGETCRKYRINVSKTPRGATKTSSLTGVKLKFRKAEF